MAHKLQNLPSEIIQILQSHSPRYVDVQVIFKGFAEIQNGRHRAILFFWGRKISRKLFKFYNHIPHHMEMCM